MRLLRYQIVMNLVTNASDALGERDGVIRVTTRYVKLGRNSQEDGLASSDHLELEVSDTGHGMPPETQSRVFDPFFTTKSAGRGLGLAVVHGIVRDLGGMILITSELDKGTTFRVLLPAGKTSAGATGEATSGVKETATSFQGATLLLVEDEGYHSRHGRRCGAPVRSARRSPRLGNVRIRDLPRHRVAAAPRPRSAEDLSPDVSYETSKLRRIPLRFRARRGDP